MTNQEEKAKFQKKLTSFGASITKGDLERLGFEFAKINNKEVILKDSVISYRLFRSSCFCEKTKTFKRNLDREQQLDWIKEREEK
jgi:hypothetical protein